MPLIERFTPGGNLYPDGSSTFVVLVELFRKLAENRDTRDATNRAAWQAGDTATLNSAKTAAQGYATTAKNEAVATVAGEATVKAGEAEARARTYTDTKSSATLNQAREYTDVSFAAAGPGGATDAQVDAAVDRGIVGGRIAPGSITPNGGARAVGKGELTVNVKDAPYNAKGDGVTDDTVAIQAALNSGAADVFFPAGTYLVKVSSGTAQHYALTSFNRNQAIRGAGYRKTRLVLGDGEGILAISRATLTGFTIDGGFTPGGARVSTLNSLVQANEDTVVSDCHIFNASGSCLVGTGQRIRYLNNRLEKFGDHGIYILGEVATTAPYGPVGTGGQDVKIDGNTVVDDPTYHNNPTYGTQRFAVKLRNNVQSVVITNNFIDGDVEVSGDTRSAAANPRGVTITKNVIRAPYAGVYCETGLYGDTGSSGHWIHDVVISDNMIYGRAPTVGTGVVLKRSRAVVVGNVISQIDTAWTEGGAGDTGVQIITNNIIRNVRVGIYAPGTGSMISGNTIMDTAVGAHVSFHAHFTRNAFTRNTTHAIRLATANHATTRILVDGNTFTTNTIGINVDSSARAAAIVRNTFIDNITSMAVPTGALFNDFTVTDNHVISGGALPLEGSADAVPLVTGDAVTNLSKLPGAEARYRGKLVRVESSTGTDQVYICRRLSTGAYEWAPLL